MMPTDVNIRSWARSLWAGALSGVLLGLFGGAFIISAFGGPPPVTIREVREVNGVALRGGRLDLLFTGDRTRQCPVVTSRYLWRWAEVDGEPIRQFVPLGTSLSGLTPVGGNKRILLSLPVPPDMPEGEWFYWSRSTSECPRLFGLSYSAVYQTPDIPVRIISRVSNAKDGQP